MRSNEIEASSLRSGVVLIQDKGALAKYVESSRKAIGLTMSDLAQRSHVSTRSICAIENAHTDTIRYQTLVRLANGMNVLPKDLFAIGNIPFVEEYASKTRIEKSLSEKLEGLPDSTRRIIRIALEANEKKNMELLDLIDTKINSVLLNIISSNGEDIARLL
ncbi:MAG: helix-turn-helix domain-containing protein [Candidatus Peregrinibacteria bacterium]|nr:helix-turn-helix domain-containing protein [Candidatus Peregrinibacteria bacterium]MCB9808497.1 helix-turn-helix domain-containing protein [Candidatus Peribacteria bacterium]